MFTEADLIHSYTRKQALEDGVLFACLPLFLLVFGFRYPVAYTASIRALLRGTGQRIIGDERDVLRLLKEAIRSLEDGEDIVWFEIATLERGEASTVRLKAIVGPGDDMEPVITIMLEDED